MADGRTRETAQCPVGLEFTSIEATRVSVIPLPSYGRSRRNPCSPWIYVNSPHFVILSVTFESPLVTNESTMWEDGCLCLFWDSVLCV